MSIMFQFNKIAIFIDADNAQASMIESIIQDVSAYGRIITKRAYANWTKPQVKPWEEKVKRYAIGTIQQFDFVSGKNASDMALTIDAMEMLHTGDYDCFVIVSSDSDFTALAIKLHESGIFVIGYGNRLTVESFRNACDEFNYVEDLDIVSRDDAYALQQMNDKKGNDSIDNDVKSQELSDKNIEESENDYSDNSYKEKEDLENNCSNIEFVQNNTINMPVSEEELESLLRIAEEKYALDDGYVNISSAGAYIKRVKSDFNIKTFGFDKLPEYIKSKPDKYDSEVRQGKGGVNLFLYRSKKKEKITC